MHKRIFLLMHSFDAALALKVNLSIFMDFNPFLFYRERKLNFVLPKNLFEMAIYKYILWDDHVQ